MYHVTHANLITLNHVVRVRNGYPVHLYRLCEVQALSEAIHVFNRPKLTIQKLRHAVAALGLGEMYGSSDLQLYMMLCQHLNARTNAYLPGPYP